MVKKKGIIQKRWSRLDLVFGVEQSLFVKVGWERCLISHAGV